MSKLSLSKHLQKKKGAASKILPGQRLMSSYFTSVPTKNPPIPTIQKNTQKLGDQENDEVEIIDVKKSDTKSPPSDNNTTLKINKTNSDVLRERPVCHPAKKVNNGIKDNSPITIKSPIKSKLNNSHGELFSTDEEMQDDSPGLKKRKRKESNSSMNIEDDMKFLAQIDDLDFSLLDDTQYDDLPLDKIHRCEVISVLYEASITLVDLASCANKNQRARCALLHTWAIECDLTIGTIVSVRAAWNKENSRWEVRDDLDHSLLVEHPDLMLGSTSIMSALRCRRSAILGENFRGLSFSDDKGFLTLGSLLHELTQECLKNGIYDQEEIINTFNSLLNRPRIVRQLYSVGHKKSDIDLWAEPYFPAIAKFMRKHASPEIPHDLICESEMNPNSDAWPGTITGIVDIEDTIWLPQLGLKGKLDLTCKVKVYPHMITKELPVELKTGQTSDNVAHRGQLMLYNTMLAELEQRPVESGLLVYLKDCKIREIKPQFGEKRDALIMRNEIARHLCVKPSVVKEGDEMEKVTRLKHAPLPPPISRAKECTLCPYVNVCTAYVSQEKYEGTMSEKMPQKERLQNPDFTQAHRDYFIHWTCLVQLEEQNEIPLTQLWTSTPQQREASKQACIAGLKVTEVNCEDDCCVLSMMRDTDEESMTFTSSSLTVGDLVVVGNKTRLAIVLASITTITAQSVCLSMEKDISSRFGKSGYYIDRYQSTRSAANKLSALGQLMAATPEAAKLRSVIIDKSPAVFEPNLDYETAMKIIPEVLNSMNDDQIVALKKVLEARDFTLIRGLPGTGKTSTIVSIVRVLVALNRSVLITSHTNSAVDNVLSRLLEHGVPLLRLGSMHRTAPKLVPHSEEKVLGHASTTQELETLYKTRIVVGVTCASVGHMLLRRRMFDVCIVDEATQVHQPAMMQALLAARTFVLVGDPDQLQPIVVNTTASKFGMKETLFERIATSDNTAVLGCQYRMNSTICELVNHVTYNGALKCGSPKVANATFSLPKAIGDSPAWLVEVLSLLPIHSVVFLDTGCVPQAEVTDKDEEGENVREASIILNILNTFKQGGVKMDDVGVMSPFRAQANLLRNLTLNDHGEELEVSTIDQFQGKDKNVALLTCVKSFQLLNDTPKERGGILNDPKRLTVALSRARVKIIIVGDMSSLQCYSPFSKMFGSLTEEQLVTLTDGERGFSWTHLTQEFKELKEKLV